MKIYYLIVLVVISLVILSVIVQNLAFAQICYGCNFPKLNLTDIQQAREKIGIGSPLKQFKAGLTFDNITCKQNLVKIMKLENNSPACVKSSTQIILEQRGWTLPITQPNKDIIFCQKNPSDTCNYTMELWYDDCMRNTMLNVSACHDGRIEAYLNANGLSNIIKIHP